MFNLRLLRKTSPFTEHLYKRLFTERKRTNDRKHTRRSFRIEKLYIQKKKFQFYVYLITLDISSSIRVWSKFLTRVVLI